MTTTRYTVTAVEKHQSPAHWRVFYHVPDNDGAKVHCYAFPASTLAWRSAEYGIDPQDAGTLLDVVLHEAHITGHDHTSPDFLYNTDRDSARAALHARIAEVKTRVEIHDPDGLLSRIAKEHQVDPDDHRSKVAHTQHVRAHGAAPSGAPTLFEERCFG